MSGFKNFLLRGNLIELAVAFIMGGAFATVVEAMVNLLMDLIGKVFNTPNFSSYNPGGVSVGAFLTALVSFVILAAVVYFFIVAPYTKAKERYFPSAPPGTPEDIKILGEIRDLLAAQQGPSGTSGTTNPGVTGGPGATNPGV
ncbi:MscL family protein [Nocardioides sp. zg-DK7169]|uniref:MscL family protein n=1 Tax=Nocardioides sp. zg-DK7169 TaxID=2736600 RepID=UPI001557C363|nr:MscL family protein [Nocardioides sp. zg-DK7169]NPC97378.1 MscL family protein [Nocardioides sp. zg-DK7169]